jgi:hypothetical protein
MLACLFAVLLPMACHKTQAEKEFMWVSAPQAILRDRVATLYNKTGTLHNGERVEVLEKQKRFVRVRTEQGQEGWVELRSLAGPDVYEGFQRLAAETARLPAQGHAAARNPLNIHVTPSRDGEVLYQLKENDKVEIFKRATAERTGARPAAAPSPGARKSKSAKKGTAAGASPEQPAAVLEDWWLVRDPQGRAGWVLGRNLDLDIPLDVAQYAEGQRVIGAFVLDQVQDGDKNVPQYLTLVTEPKDGLPYDFDQIRVFTWNLKRHRYETGYRERKLFGVLPVTIGRRDFPGEGALPIFTIRVQGADGKITERTYRLIGPIVRRVLAEGEKSAPVAKGPARRKRRR